MTARTQAAMLQAIADAPDDDFPRVAYADWLEEQGDTARADFIRVQCSLTSLPESDPQRPELMGREQALLNQYGWAWAEELGTEISEWQFRRGFIERVAFCLEQPSEAIVAFLQKAPTVRHLRDMSQLCELQGVVEALPHFSRLTGLEFWTLYAFDDVLLRQMLESPHLANLKTLILHHDRNGNLADEQVVADAMGMANRSHLEELAVNVDGMWRGPTRPILRAMAASPYLRKLKRLNLSNAGDPGNHPEIDAETLRILGKSPNLAGLESLDLGQTSFPIEGWDEVLKWPCLSKLKWLRLHYARQVEPPSTMTVDEIDSMDDYREAFERQVANIDWESEFITPWDGNASWKGLSWDAFKRQHLFGMWSYVKELDFAGLEAAYRKDCRKYAEAAVAPIDGLPFDRYERNLAAGYQQAVARAAREANAEAIVLRIRPDLDWSGKFAVSSNADPEPFEPRDEFSYGGMLVEFDSPAFPEAAVVRDQLDAQQTPPLDPGGAWHYLLARTAAAVGRAVAKVRSPVPVYFSCMYVLLRMTRLMGK